MQLVVDSSIFVAAFREQEKYSEACLDLIEKIETGEVSAVIPTTVLLEVVAAVSRRTSDAGLARRVGMRLVSFSGLSLIDLTTFRTLQYLDATADLKLAGMDAIVVGTAVEFQLPLVTLDKEIIARAGETIKIIPISSIKNL
ncbi:MAG: type II toxin-antitoxin system VapC family toxin [Patescibacteria group bacterium]